ncbi:MAG: GDP-L-fucose synthase [Candidatus Delongbacteria bacterium]|nr:GDP-L-fucose synthase [Candidatus Delongbacteria bacterium]
MDLNSKIYVAGHQGMVGSAIVRNLIDKDFQNIIVKTLNELDLTNQSAVNSYLEEVKPEYMFIAAAKVGGIHANNIYPAEFIYDNLMIEANLIHGAYANKVKKLLFLGSSCIYPKMSPQPIKEEYLLTGPLEPTNEAYAIAKISGVEMCKFYKRQYGCNFISAMPTNLYGIHDNFDLETSHVLPALIRKFHDAKVRGDKEIIMWGSGKIKREFLYVDDLADACVHLMNNYNEEIHVNVGTGEDLEIIELANVIKEIVEFEGEIKNDLAKPDGTPRKLLDVTLLNNTGWKYKINLKEGIERTYKWYLENIDTLRK